MKIVVCVKQVPEIAEVKIDPEMKTLMREGVPSILNPFDEFAVEEALRIREKHGGEVIIITMGPPQARDALLKCLAMGADRAIHLTDRAFAGADTLATAKTLARAIKHLSFDLIICGKQAIDGDTAQIPPELAECLHLPHIDNVKKVEVDSKKERIVAQSMSDEGFNVIECGLPVLLSAIKGLNEPRIPTVLGIIKAGRKEVKIVNAAELGGDLNHFGLRGSPTQVIEVFTPEPRGKGTIIHGEDSNEAASKLVQFLIKEVKSISGKMQR